MAKKNEPLVIDGKRLDGRSFDQMREIEAKIGIVKRANGSGYFRFGNTIAIAAVYGPRGLFPKFLQDSTKSIIKCKYTMMPFSTKERIRPGRSRRSTEISKVIKEAFSNIVFLEEFPRTCIDIYIDIIQADASTRCAALNAASLALADAGIPMRSLVSCCSVGKIDNNIVLDISGIEDNYGQVDMPVAIDKDNNIVLLQIDGIISKKEFSDALALAIKGCNYVYKKQEETIREKYKTKDE